MEEREAEKSIDDEGIEEGNRGVGRKVEEIMMWREVEETEVEKKYR